MKKFDVVLNWLVILYILMTMIELVMYVTVRGYELREWGPVWVRLMWLYILITLLLEVDSDNRDKTKIIL